MGSRSIGRRRTPSSWDVLPLFGVVVHDLVNVGFAVILVHLIERVIFAFCVSIALRISENGSICVGFETVTAAGQGSL